MACLALFFSLFGIKKILTFWEGSGVGKTEPDSLQKYGIPTKELTVCIFIYFVTIHHAFKYILNEMCLQRARQVFFPYYKHFPTQTRTD